MEPTMKSSDLAEQLREAGRKLASGEMEVVTLPMGYIMANLLPEDADKITPSYIRTTIKRVPEVREFGSVSVHKVMTDNGEVYEIRLIAMEKTRANQRRVFTPGEQRKLRNTAAAKAMRELLSLTPDFSDLSPEDMVTSVMAVKRMHEIIKQRVENMEDSE